MNEEIKYEWTSKSTLCEPYACYCIGPENCKNKECQLVKDYKRKEGLE